MEKRKKVGLALGGGAWRGLAHIGVIKTLLKNKIPIDYIAGSSAGALIGGMYAALQDIDEIEKIARGINYRDLVRVLGDPLTSGGLLKGRRFINFLEKYVKDVKIESLETPFAAIATDIRTSEAIAIYRGELSKAIRASGSVPFVFSPTENEDRILIDGGIAMPVPTDVARDMGADVVIGVNLYGNIFPLFDKDEERKMTSIQISFAAAHVALNKMAEINMNSADIKIVPVFAQEDFGFFRKFVEYKEAIEDGEIATQKKIEEIKNLVS